MLTQAELKHLLHYNFETGVFTWKNPRSNSIKVGAVAGKEKPKGYIQIGIRVNGIDKRFYAHRLAWLYVYGEMPSDIIDHKDCNPKNNLISNLRKATHKQNMRNSVLSSRNKSGYKGVCWYKPLKKWNAQIEVNNKKINLGYFENPEDAHKTYCNAAFKYFEDFANFGSIQKNTKT
jgi:hypothetical protein